MTGCVIYRRVSSAKQTTQGDGLGSQETRCREYAKFKGYVVEKVFTDDMSGGNSNRPGMNAMLAYLRRRRGQELRVIIDDISRLARGLDAHLQLRANIANVGAILESPSIEFGDDSDSILVENLLASVSQHQRQKNGEQTINRMRARVLNGYWVFQAPIGYKYQRVKGQGNLLVRDEPMASIVQEMLEGYGSGRLQIQAECKRFLEQHPEYPRDRHGEVRMQRVKELLTRPVYAGLVEAPNWDVSIRPGQHEGLISLEMYQKIQTRLQDNAKTPARKDLALDFPLRGAVVCSSCSTLLTASWTTGNTARHPYYLCRKRGCERYGKSIRRDKIEGEFEALLQGLTPAKPIFKIAAAMFEAIWDFRIESQAVRSKQLQADAHATQKKIDQLLDRIMDAESGSVIKAYEAKIAKLEQHKLELEERAMQSAQPRYQYDPAVRTSMLLLANPHKLWASGVYEAKRAVLKLLFSDKLAYCGIEGFRTPAIALPARVLSDFVGRKTEWRGVWV